MTTLEFKNEMDFLANSHDAKRKAFNDMCETILRTYNRLSGTHYKTTDNHKTSLLRLFDKIEHIIFYLYSPQSVPSFLYRIATKPKKVIARPPQRFDNPNEHVYGLGHFRWDYRAYELNPNELKAIRIYLGIHIPNPTQHKKYSTDEIPVPDFDKISGYNEKAEAFLMWTKTDFSVEFKQHAPYFPEDTESRDIFEITLKNNNHKYRFTFGQSIANTGELPTEYDVLAAITKYPVYDFEDFCGDFGYDSDSRKAYKIYKAVKKEWENISLLFSQEQLELLQEIN